MQFPQPGWCLDVTPLPGWCLDAQRAPDEDDEDADEDDDDEDADAGSSRPQVGSSSSSASATVFCQCLPAMRGNAACSYDSCREHWLAGIRLGKGCSHLGTRAL